jgi:NAD(P)-dependent dehydrogenase (short-subunit alcohol dehydrogenase family)
MDHELLVKNAVSAARTIKAFGVPVVHSTVNVASGQGPPTIPELAGLLETTNRSTCQRLTTTPASHSSGSSSAPLDLELRPYGIRVNAVAPQLMTPRPTGPPADVIAHAVAPEAVATRITMIRR